MRFQITDSRFLKAGVSAHPEILTIVVFLYFKVEIIKYRWDNIALGVFFRETACVLCQVRVFAGFRSVKTNLIENFIKNLDCRTILAQETIALA